MKCKSGASRGFVGRGWCQGAVTSLVLTSAMDLPVIGEHCSHCNVLDFLPIKCTLCRRTFCKTHSFRDCHECTGPSDSTTDSTLQEVLPESNSGEKRERCSFTTCRNPTIASFSDSVEDRCSRCSKTFCIS